MRPSHMQKIHVTHISAMSGRKKGNKARGGERVQVHATLTFSSEPDPGHRPRDPPGYDTLDKEGGREGKEKGGGGPKGAKAAGGGERVSFAEHAIKILDHMMKEKSVSEVLKLGPREEMLGLTPLCMAAAIGHVEGTRRLLEAGAAVEDRSSDGSTALLNAAHWRHLPVLDLLLQHGAKVSAVNNEGNNALMVALRHGDVRAVNSLWPHRSQLDINQTNNEGSTAIHLAAERKWESCVQFLIQNGANVNKQNNLGQTALHIAAAKGDHATSERLLSSNADILLEDNSGNNPYCLAVRNFHDFLASYFLAKLKQEDKDYFCMRRVLQIQSPLSPDTYSAWNAVSFLVSDTSLRDSLYHCDIIMAALHMLARRGLLSEIALHICLVICDLMYNPFPVPDARFVKQFLLAHGPEIVLERLESRNQEMHNLECKEVIHIQSHMQILQSHLQTRQQQLDFMTAFLLLPVMAMTETPQGREWFADIANQQRLSVHLRRLTPYRELLPLVSLFQQDVCTRDIKLDRVAIVERFSAFFNTLENKDHEKKVRELLELEEREKSRKEKKREKKRLQRIKQKLKTKACGSSEEIEVVKDALSRGESSKGKSKPLDALDDIPLMVSLNRVQDGPDLSTSMPVSTQDPAGGEDEWMMVGGKRCYPVKVRPQVPICLVEPSVVADLETSSPEAEASRPPNVCSELELGLDHMGDNKLDAFMLEPESVQRQVVGPDSGTRVHKEGVRWADIARLGNSNVLSEESSHSAQPSRISTPPLEQNPVSGSSKKKDTYQEQFPSLGQQGSGGSPTSKLISENSGVFDVLGAAHQFLENLVNGTGFMEKLNRPGSSTCSCQSSQSHSLLEPSVLYEALTGWMWQAAVAQGLVSPGTNPPPTPDNVDFLTPLTNQFSKPKAPATSQHNLNESPSSPAPHATSSLLQTNSACAKESAGEALKKRSNLQNPYASGHSLRDVQDWFDMAELEKELPGLRRSSLFQDKHAESSTLSNMNRILSFDDMVQASSRIPSSQSLSSMDGGLSIKENNKFASNSLLMDENIRSRPSTVNRDWMYGQSQSEACLDGELNSRPVTSSNDFFTLPREDFPESMSGSKHQFMNTFEEMSYGGKFFDSDSPKHFLPLTGQDIDQDQNEDDFWFSPSCGIKPQPKTAVISVRARLSDSMTEDQSDGGFQTDSNCATPAISRSNCMNSYDSYTNESLAASASAMGLQECLAPGFLRAASGEIHRHAFRSASGSYEDDISGGSRTFQPVISHSALLATLSKPRDARSQCNLQQEYPDLSTIPEREHSLTPSSTLSMAARTVGQGRPRRSDSKTSTWQAWIPGDARNASRSSSLDKAYSKTADEQRPPSPDVLFPELLRDEGEPTEPSAPVDVFPSIHDMSERDLFQDVFSNTYFLEQIAIDQIRRRLRSLGCGEDAALANSVLFHDLDYYASLYGMRLRDILGPSEELRSASSENVGVRKMTDQSVPPWKALVKELGRKMTTKEEEEEAAGLDLDLPSDSEDAGLPDWPWNHCKVATPEIVSGGDCEGEAGWWQGGGGSRRWRVFLRQILDMPWTMRRQYGKIVLPARSMEFNIGRTGRHPLILGFLTDGSEVAVLALDRTRHALDTRLMAIVAADSEPDVHFVLRYKAVWECAGRVYLAMELCDYTLDEYVGIVQLDHRQDPLSANRLAWQLLKGLKYLHSNFAVPHGNLMPGWIFVDCVGRLRLAGYGLRDVTGPAHSACRESADRSSIEGDLRFWRSTEHVSGSCTDPSFEADIQVAGMLLHYILAGGRHPYGDSAQEVDSNMSRSQLRQNRISQEADHLVYLMTLPDPASRPSIDQCLKHPFFWSGEKRFRLVLIVGSDILTEMKTGVPLTGAGSTTMVDILNIVHINTVSDNWLSEVDSVLVKEMRAFRQYKNTLPELVLFVYNCCLHFDKMSVLAKEVLDDPCKYFQSRFPALFMAVYRAMRASDRTDRSCYKPFF